MKKPMESALQIARENLKKIRMVTEWATVMGYDCPKKFARKFKNHFGERPLKVLNLLKLIKAIQLLRATDKKVYEIGCCELCIGDEKRFYQFIKYHTDYSPREIRDMADTEVIKIVEKL